jgi:hypothetical protein
MLVVVVSIHANDSVSVTDARKSVDQWLQLVDDGHFSNSLDNASSMLRDAISNENWNRALRTSRSPLGKIGSRKLMGAKFVENLPGAPTGEYVVFGFASAFDTKDNMIETVTARKDDDGIWRVAGYFIR